MGMIYTYDNFTLGEVDHHNIWHFRFNSQYECAMYFMRMQEFYESPDVQLKMLHFTLEFMIDRAVAEKGSWTYYSDWDGFNVPGHIADFFFDKFKDLRPRELEMLEVLKQANPPRPYYIIGTGKNSAKTTLDHEIRHGLWYLYDDYKKSMIETIRNHNTEALRKVLKKLGYCDEVMEDEIQAYLLTGLYSGMRDTKTIKVLRKELRKIEKKFL